MCVLVNDFVSERLYLIIWTNLKDTTLTDIRTPKVPKRVGDCASIVFTSSACKVYLVS